QPPARFYSAIDALREVIKSGKYKTPATKLIPGLEAEVMVQIDTLGMTPLDAARHVLAPFEKPKSVG
ncbi:MAG: hypothetical protein ACREEA_10570, partial [Stellaceae bacterium]